MQLIMLATTAVLGVPTRHEPRFELLNTVDVSEPSSGRATVTTPNFDAPPPQDFSLLGNGTLFTQWRPKAHYIQPFQITGDPTSMWADRPGRKGASISTIFGYLRTISGNSPFASSLRAARTEDWVTFQDVGITIGPGGRLDPAAIFDGKAVPHGYNGLPTLMYTAVSYQPIYWKYPYVRGAERQAIAYSKDNGTTWIKVDLYPSINGPPAGVNITGFRDPYPFQSPAVDRAFGVADAQLGRTWYATVSGGDRVKGARIFLYRMENNDWLNWTYVGTPLAPRANTTFGEFAWTANDGINFECVTPVFLGPSGDDPNGHAVITMGAEGNRTLHPWQMWKLGEWKASVTGGPVEFNVHATGLLDAANGYACTGVEDNSDGRRIYTCAFNEDFASDVHYKQEWRSSLSLLREIFVRTFEVPDTDYARRRASWAVKLADGSTVPANSDAISRSANGSLTLVTLGQRPVRELKEMRKRAVKSWTVPDLHLNPTTARKNCRNAHVEHRQDGIYFFVPFAQSPSSRHWEMEATLTFNPKVLRNARASTFAAGFTVMSGRSESAVLAYQPANESVAVLRDDLALSSQIVYKTPAVGKLRLWDVKQDDGSFATESLHLRAFMDGSGLEVFINDHFVLSTRLYYWYPDSTQMGFWYRLPHNISSSPPHSLPRPPPATGHSSEYAVSWTNVRVWEGLFEAFPNRSKDPRELGAFEAPIGFPQPARNPNGPLYYDNSYLLPNGHGTRWRFQDWAGA